MSGGDLLFYVCALVAVAGGLASSLSRDLRRAARWMLVSGGGVAGLLAVANAAAVSGLLGMLVLVGLLLLRRLTGPTASVEESAPLESGLDDEDGAVRNEEQVETEGSVPQGAVKLRAGAKGIGLASQGRIRTALLVLAFFVIALRAVLIVRWPLLGPATAAPGTSVPMPWIPAVSLPHWFVTVLALFCVGLFAAMSRRSASGIGMGIALMHAAVGAGFCAAAHFVGGGPDMQALAVAAVVIAAITSATTMLADSRASRAARESEAAALVASTIATVVGGVTLALLAGAW